MSLLAKANSSTEFKVPDEGTHLGVCNAIVGVGLQDTPWGAKEKVYIRWEIPAQRIQFEKDGIAVDLPLTIWANYTLSLSEKANLRQALEGWNGHVFTKKELNGVDLFDLIGRPCQLTITHNESGDRIYANVQSIGKVKEGKEVPTQEMYSITYSQGAADQWDDLPEWLQEKIRNRVKKDAPQPSVQADPFIDDTIPFNQEVA